MKVYKKNILIALLLTFTFFVTHDYFVKDVQVFKHSIVHNEVDIKKDMKIHLHESIHSIYSKSLEEESLFQGKLVDTNPSNSSFSVTKNITQVPQRPPSV